MSGKSDLDALIDLAQRSIADDATGRDALKTLLDAFGGFPAVAGLIKDEFDRLPEGHSARIKLLTMITHAVLNFGEETTGTGDLEEDEAQLALLFKQLRENESEA